MIDIFHQELTMLINDEGFSLSERGLKACLCAKKVLQLKVENTAFVQDFYHDLITSLQSCIDHDHPRKVKAHTLREKMWEKYYKLQSSQQFVHKWTEFLQKGIGFCACPTFYQYITNKNFLECTSQCSV